MHLHAAAAGVRLEIEEVGSLDRRRGGRTLSRYFLVQDRLGSSLALRCRHALTSWPDPGGWTFLMWQRGAVHEDPIA